MGKLIMNYKDITVFYIIGTGHSGSTLLDLILGKHSQIFGAGELCSFSSKKGKIKSMICSCHKKVYDCFFWKKASKDLKGINTLNLKRNIFNFLFNRKRYFLRNNNKKVNLKEYLDINNKLFKNISKISGKKIIIDSSKQIDRAEALSQSDEIEIIFIHLIRNGKGIIWSYKKKNKNLFFSIFLWIITNIKAEILKRRNKDIKSILIRYEDFAREPQKELKKILEMKNLNWESNILNFSQKQVNHQIAGNRLRLKEIIDIREDLNWKKNLNFFDKLIFFLFGKLVNKFYGY